MATRGSYNYGKKKIGGGASPKILVLCNFLKYSWFQTELFTRLLELVQLYRQNPKIENIFIFTIVYQNYTLALPL